MTLFTPSLMEAVTGDTPITYHAQDFRNIISALSPVEGIVSAGDLAVTQRGAGANMSVDVAAGKALIQGDSIANQGTYICYSNATFNVALTAANATNPRIDIIVARVFDKQADGGSTYGWTLSAIAGTPAASPVAPAVPASTIKLADVRVNANATSVTTSSITDWRQLSGVGDVPKWDVFGTAPQSVPTGTAVPYVPTGTFQVVNATVVSNGKFRIQTPGRYMVHFCVRMAATAAACNRIVTLEAANSAGVVGRRIANSVATAASIPVSTSGSIYLSAGDTITALIFQDSPGALNVSDPYVECDFTAVWVGP